MAKTATRRGRPATDTTTTFEPIEQARSQVIAAVGGKCEHCNQLLPGAKIAPIAREVGVTPVTFSAFLAGKNVSMPVFGRILSWLQNRPTETDEQASAVEAVAALD